MPWDFGKLVVCIISTISFIFILSCVVLIAYTEDNLGQHNAGYTVTIKHRPIELLNLTLLVSFGDF